MDFEPSELIAKIKQNKLAIPAILVGVALGGYLLYEQSKNGGLAAVGVSPIDQAPEVPATGSDGGAVGTGGSGVDNGTGDTSILSDLQNQIGQIAQSTQDGLNALSDQFFGALNNQAQDVQNALNGQANNGGSQPYYPDGYASSLDAGNGALLSGLTSLFGFGTTQPVTENAVTPEDLFHGSLVVTNPLNKLAEINLKQSLKNKVQAQPQVVHIQLPPVQNFANNVGQLIGNFVNALPKPQLPAAIQSFYNPNVTLANASKFADIRAASGYSAALSTAPKITPNFAVANAILHKGQGSQRIEEF